MVADRNWLDVSGWIPRPFKGKEAVIGYQIHDKAVILILLIINVFKKYFI